MNNEYRDIISFDGVPLKCLIRETGSSKWLIVTHGLGEHQGRHEFILKLFSQNFNIAIYDLRGHGRSGGRPAYVEDFKHYWKDLHSVIEYLRKEFSMNHYTLFGHSMGGLITAGYLQNMASADFYPDKVFLSSPCCGASGLIGPVFANSPKILMESLAKLPSFPLKGVLNIRKLSHDSRVYESYVKDEQVHLSIHSHLYFELLKSAREVFSRPLRASCALYGAIGTGDVLVNPGLMTDYFAQIEKKAQIKVIEGGYHELHNEVEKFRKPYLNFLRQSLTGLSFE